MTAAMAKALHKVLADSTGIEYRDTNASDIWRPSFSPRTADEVARLNELVGYEKYRAVAS